MEQERKEVEEQIRKENEEAERKRQSQLRKLKEQQKDEEVKIERDQLLSGVNSELNDDKEISNNENPVSEISEEPDQDDSKRRVTTTNSILRKISTTKRISKRVTFNTINLEMQPKSINEDFIRKVPEGSIKLSEEQKEILINILEDPSNEDNDVLLSLEKDQIEDVVITNYIGDNATIYIPLEDKREIINRETNRVSVYPKNSLHWLKNKNLKDQELVYIQEIF